MMSVGSRNQAPEKNEEDGARTEQQAEETRPGLLRLNSYVLSTAKKFESLASPQSPPHQNTHFIPSKRPQAPTEELIQRGEEQPEKSLANTTAENKEENADQSNVELNGGTTEVSVDIHVNEHIFNEAVAPAEHPVISTTAENKGEYADTADDQSNVEQSEVKVSADAHVESPAAETFAAAGTEECKDTAEILLKPQEEPSSEIESANATKLEDAGVEPTVQHAERSCEKCPPEAVIVVESSPDESDVINATPEEEAAVQQIVEPVADLVADFVSELPPQPSAEAATDGNQDKGPPQQAVLETVETITEINVASVPEAPAVIEAAGEEAVQQSVEQVPDLVVEYVSELPPEPAAEAATEGSQDEGPPEKASEESVEAVVAVEVESSPNESDVVNATPEEEATVQQSVESVADLVADFVSELPPQPAAEAATDGNQDEGPPQQAVLETVETITEINVASVPEAPAVIEAAGEEAVVQQSVEQVPDLVVEYVSELPPEPAAEAATEGGHDEGPPEKASEESVEAVVTVEVESSPNESDVVNATPEEEATVQQSVESVPDLLQQRGSHDKDPPEQAVVETVETITEVNVASVPEAPAVIEAAGEEAVVQQSVEQVPDLVVESVSELPPEPAAEAATEGNHDKGPPEQAAEEAVNPETEVNVASSPAVTDAAGDDTAVQDSVEQIPDLVVESESELPPQPAVETAAIYAASTEPVLQTRAEEVVECEVQPANNTVVEQSIELPHESTPGRKVEPCIEDVLEPTTAPEAEAAQEFTYRAIELTDALDVKPPAPEDEAAQEFTYRAIELTEALDVEPPPPEAADEPLKSPEQSHTEEMTPAM
ncbi:hypothetical protein E3U43_022534 [Larimichthys crocea]|uniref:Uncharacterized protein n=1 Tax=Larimichthys crocea TaxID=215358 RepID=A0ACD3R3R0_LARCR|nr:hypothetical protein E3U43_022534 [Larimichthys crocea]